MDTLGSRIALYRNSKRWTQEKLASELGILQSSLSEIENDHISPKWELITQIAEKLSVPVARLISLNDSAVMSPSLDDNSTESQTSISDDDSLLKEILVRVLETQNKLIEMLDKMNS